MADGTRRAFSKSMSFRVVVYPAEFDQAFFNAHCLELDLFGQARSVEGAIAELMQAIETQLDSCWQHKAQFEHWAPPAIWQKYDQARRAKRKIPDELLDRIVREANKRLGYESPVKIDSLAGTPETREALEECAAAVA